jgi:hypothetical protein
LRRRKVQKPAVYQAAHRSVVCPMLRPDKVGLAGVVAALAMGAAADPAVARGRAARCPCKKKK